MHTRYLHCVYLRFCPECKNDASEIVQGGESLKHSKKKAKMASASSTSKRDWGKVRNLFLFHNFYIEQCSKSILNIYFPIKCNFFQGMACVGRSKICTIVPPNHMGPVPGIEVGTMWKFRVQVRMQFQHFLLFVFFQI